MFKYKLNSNGSAVFENKYIIDNINGLVSEIELVVLEPHVNSGLLIKAIFEGPEPISSITLNKKEDIIEIRQSDELDDFTYIKEDKNEALIETENIKNNIDNNIVDVSKKENKNKFLDKKKLKK